MQYHRLDDQERTEAFQELIALAPSPELAAMMRDLSTANVIYQPSTFWLNYVRRNLKQLRKRGVQNFKQTVNQNYFNWVGNELKEQMEILRADLGSDAVARASKAVRPFSSILQKPRMWRFAHWRRYLEFLQLLRPFVEKRDRLGILEGLEEPELGKPIGVSYGGLRNSQDICNSVLEVNSATEDLGWDPQAPLRVAELGSGYGRVAYVLLKAAPGASVTLIDIPPALYIAQWYLTRLFPDRQVFHYRSFADYDSVRDEIESSSIVFLAPPQVEMLRDDSFDLFVNVSSLHEMTFAQIALWFEHINRLCTGHFYTKQWNEHENSFDDIVVKRSDYPYNSGWTEVFNRTCELHPRFFEGLYRCR